MRTLKLSLLALAMAAFSPAGPAAASEEDAQAGTLYKVSATNARMIRQATGPVTSAIRGVPAEPLDSFVHDGDPGGIEPLDRARVTLSIDPVANAGRISARWTDSFGRWTYQQTAYAPPSHPTGLRVAPASADRVFEPDDPVTTNVYLHGDTTAGGPVLPTLFNLLTTWGPARVTLNGRQFANPFDGPAPLWVGHTMTTVGARNPDGTVLTPDGDIFDPLDPGNGAVDNDDLEFHLVFHDAPGPMTTNFPPAFSFFYHLQFEDVTVEVAQPRNDDRD